MPKVTLVHTNFTAGELTPKMWGRVDVARYQNGAEIIENGWPVIHGGVQKRWGTLFHYAAKHADKVTRLVPFIFSRTQAYMLEFGHNYMRVHTDVGVILSAPSTPYEVATPYTEAMLAAIDFTQAADTMLIWHQGVPVRRLRRFADDNWVLDLAPFSPSPFDEIGHRPAAGITLSSASVGTGRTITADASAFIEGDVGREVWAGVGTATITAYTSATQVTATVVDAFDSTTYAANDWRLVGSPQANIVPSAVGPVSGTITLTSAETITTSAESQKTIAGISHDGSSTVTVTIAGHGYSTGNTISHTEQTPVAYRGSHSITVVNANTYTYTLSPDPGAATDLGKARRVTSTSSYTDAWRAADVGSHVEINQGLVRITGYTSATEVQALVLRELNTTVTSVANAWRLMAPVWNDVDGYPATGTFHMQRLVAAGSPAYPQTVWGSAIGGYYDFLLGVNDDEAFAFSMLADDLNPITYLSSMEALIALTYGAEFTMEGGVEKPITPTNVRARQRSNNGCEQVRPVRVGDEEFFVQRAGKAVRALSYNIDTGKWGVPDVSVLADHITEPGVASLSWHRNPGTLVFAAREDGVLASCTFDRDQDVAGWARQTFDGVVESVATIPAAGGDRTWLIVRRTINGSTVRYIEKFDADTYTDCAIKGASTPGATVWTGLGHIEGKTVSVLADGVPQPAEVVSGGQITLARKAYTVEIGLPVTMRLKLLPPEVGGSGGAAQANSQRTSAVFVRVLDTTGLMVNGQTVAFRALGEDVLDQPAPTFTGLKQVENLGWERGNSEVVIEHTDPLQCHILGVIRKFTWNEG